MTETSALQKCNRHDKKSHFTLNRLIALLSCPGMLAAMSAAAWMTTRLWMAGATRMATAAGMTAATRMSTRRRCARSMIHRGSSGGCSRSGTGPPRACYRTMDCSAGPVRASGTTVARNLPVATSSRTVEFSGGTRERAARSEIPRRAARTVQSTVYHRNAASEIAGVVIEDGTVMPSNSPVAPSPTPMRE